MSSKTLNDLNYGVKHIAFIMDGNGRWAKKRHKPRSFGHSEGGKRIFEIALECNRRKIEVMTCYAFSTENWNRPKSEINFLFSSLNKEITNRLPTLKEHGIKVATSGDLTKLPKKTQELIAKAKEETKDNKGLIFNICLNYGSYAELERAIKNIASDYKNELITLDEINSDLISSYLYTAGYPPVDVLIRTSGEQRLSNFLLFQLAYTELIFNPVYWPDYREEQLEADLVEFSKRKRRFGGIEE